MSNRPDDLPESNHYASKDFELLKKEYAYLFPQIQIKDDFLDDAQDFAKKAIAKKDRYQAVADKIGCPWWFVAVIHYREASLDWDANIANGDPYNEVTVHVPEGRGPFESWEDAAVDALTFEGYAGLSDWSFERCLWRLEGYNGWGYRLSGHHTFICKTHKDADGNVREGTFSGTYVGSMQDTTPRNADPYMYNGTQFYNKGVSIEDHSFYPDAVDDQDGVMILVKAIQNAGEKIA